MTITEKILAAHCNQKKVSPGEFIQCRVDIALGNDITAPIAVEEFKRAGGKKVFDRTKVVFVLDHFTPNKDIKSAEQCKFLRDFASQQGIVHFYEGGNVGVEHALLPEQGVVLPGDVVIGADSHTCTYGALGAFASGVGSTDLAAIMLTGEIWLKVPSSIKFIYKGKLKPWVCGKDLIIHTIGKIGVDGANYQAMEFCGEAIERLPMADRLTMCNMAIEGGAKSGIIVPDDITIDYIETRAERPYEIFKSDQDAGYANVLEINCDQIDPQVAFPSLPSNARPVEEAGNIVLDQVVIGSCTNGRIEDLRIAGQVLSGKKAASRVRLIIIPATPLIYRQALEEGLLKIFAEAGAIISPPTCGPCLGGHMGILAAGERCLATTNRNFVGRMGHPKSEVYLASPAVAAASAITGKITHPGKV